MKQRVSMITLGVSDVARSRAFYESLGWTAHGEPGPIAFFQAGDMIFSVWERGSLAKDSEMADNGGWGGATLAVIVASRDEVDATTEEWRSAGATVAREPADTFWGGYDSIVVDPDGHPWEIAHNPTTTLTEDGGVRL